jgi:hypothetical protein
MVEPAALPPRDNPLVPVGQEARWGPEPVWVLQSRDNYLAPAGNRTLAMKLAVRGWSSIAGKRNAFSENRKLFQHKEINKCNNILNDFPKWFGGGGGVCRSRALLCGLTRSCEEPDVRYWIQVSPDAYATSLYCEVGIVAARARRRETEQRTTFMRSLWSSCNS